MGGALADSNVLHSGLVILRRGTGLLEALLDIGVDVNNYQSIELDHVFQLPGSKTTLGTRPVKGGGRSGHTPTFHFVPRMKC